MDPYNFWQDFFDTYQSLSDWMKALWLIVPPGFVLGLIALMRRPTTGSKRPDQTPHGELIYSIHRDAEDRLHVISYVPRTGSDDRPGLILIDRTFNDPDVLPSSARQ